MLSHPAAITQQQACLLLQQIANSGSPGLRSHHLVHSLVVAVGAITVVLFSTQLQCTWQVLVQVDIAPMKVNIPTGTRLISYFKEEKQNLPLITAIAM